MRQLEGLCSLRHGEIMCVFLSAPLPAILLGLSDIYSKSRDSKVGLFLFPRRGLYQIQSLVAGSLSSSLVVRGRKYVAIDSSQLLLPEPDWVCSST
jgi:hypothetical protein